MDRTRAAEQTTSPLDEQFLKMVVSIERLTSLTNGQPLGTGFILLTTNKHIVVVTAKHVVVDDSNNIRSNLAIRLNERSNTTTILTDTFLRPIVGDWFVSKDVDLACRLITYSDSWDVKAFPLDRFLPQKRVNAGAPVVVLGFPMGLRSERYAAPVARRGMVARSGSDELMIDAFIFPGNSGGPVVYTPPLKIGGGSGGITVESPYVEIEMIIGLVVNYIPFTDVAISSQTRRPRITFEENSGLCHAIPSDKILELLWSEDFLKFERTLPK